MCKWIDVDKYEPQAHEPVVCLLESFVGTINRMSILCLSYECDGGDWIYYDTGVPLESYWEVRHWVPTPEYNDREDINDI